MICCCRSYLEKEQQHEAAPFSRSLAAISDSKTPIPFEAQVTSRSVYSFDVHHGGNSGVLKNASYNRNAVSVIHQSDAQLIPGEDTFTDPVLVRNPYYQTLTRDQKASLPANLR